MIALTRWDMELAARGSESIPSVAGPMWRGAFGHALRAASCLTGAPDCAGCPMLERCPYPEVFETPVPRHGEVAMLENYQNAPPPYVFETGTGGPQRSGQTYQLSLILFGRAGRHQRLLRTALRDMVDRAESRPDGGWVIQNLTESTPIIPEPSAAPAAVRVVLETPLRLRVRGQYLKPDDFTFAAMFSSLLRRITQLCAIHADGPPEFDAKTLVSRAQEIKLRSTDLSWQKARRYSSRQKQVIPLDGLTGHFDIDEDLSEFWPWLWYGQWLHVGKSSVMGLGRYRLLSLTD